MDHLFCQFTNGEFTGIADIYRAGDFILIHHAKEGLDEVIHIAEGSGLLAVAINCDIFVLEGLNNEIGNYASIIRQHSRPVGIENANDPDIDAVLTVVIEKEGFSAALSFIIAGAGTDRIYIAAVILRLRMDGRVPVNFRSGCLEDPCVEAFG